MLKTTPFHAQHLASHAKMVDFAGWEMPLHYGSQIDEHHQVRNAVGMFDVSHMGILDLHGEKVQSFLRYLVANNIDKLVEQQALYTCMLNAQGGVIDDLIIYKYRNDYFRLVVNAGTYAKDLDWIQEQSKTFDIKIIPRSDLVMLAIQGPQATEKLSAILNSQEASACQSLRPFTFMESDHLFIARTGYTGENGFEIIFPASEAHQCWEQLLAQGVKPIGLGARDTLRLEAGFNLYGADMDETISPLESNLSWTVALQPETRDFIGRAALEAQLQNEIKQKLVGLVLDGAGIMRNHQVVLVPGLGEGEITSGGFSPTLGCSIALARLPLSAFDHCQVVIRNKNQAARIVKPPFVRHGKKSI